jgi:hypothetical protein
VFGQRAIIIFGININSIIQQLKKDFTNKMSSAAETNFVGRYGGQPAHKIDFTITVN